VTRPAALGKGGGGGGATAGLPAGSEDPELCTAVVRPSPKFVLGFLPRIREDNINAEANPGAPIERFKRTVMLPPALRPVRETLLNGLGPLTRSLLRETACSTFSCARTIVQFVVSFFLSHVSPSLKLVLDDQKLQQIWKFVCFKSKSAGTFVIS
jgi:hypothetical protein